ncbi:hypothetical protein RCH14_004550 [Massilia sp. MP_M2]|uniref:hypothetical protein n=1 Tax=Massilia sp. MP_M2 TaxID=3071713 RepID=UPI00319E6F9E
MSNSHDWLREARFDSPDPEHTAWLHQQDVKFGRVEPSNDSEHAMRQEVLDQVAAMEADEARAKPNEISSMTNNTKPFDIPAINNQKEVLIRYLGLDHESESDRNSVQEIANPNPTGFWPACVFEHQNIRYQVTHASSKMEADKSMMFNSNMWNIKQLPALTNQNDISMPFDPVAAASGGAGSDGIIRIGANTAEAFHVGDEAYTVEAALVDGRLAYYGGDGKHPYLPKEEAVELARQVNVVGAIDPGAWLDASGYPLGVSAAARRELEEQRSLEDERSGIDEHGM